MYVWTDGLMPPGAGLGHSAQPVAVTGSQFSELLGPG